jgi:hypothetical protein
VTFTFKRPNEAQRLTFLKPVLEELGFSPQQIQSLATATGATHGRTYGYTYSDLAQPSAGIAAGGIPVIRNHA